MLRRALSILGLCSMLGAGFASLACTGETPELEGPVDASADAASNDAGGGGDDGASGNDGGVDSGPGTFCSKKKDASWCEDFDSPTPDIAPVSNQPDLPLGKLATNNFVTPPRSFRLEMPPGRAPVQSTNLPRAFPNASKIRLELDLRVAAADPIDAYQTMQLIILKRGDAEAQLARLCVPTDASTPSCSYVVTNCVAGINCSNRPISLKASTDWSRVAIEASFATDGHVSFSQDGVTDVDAAANLAPTVGTTEPLQVYLGIVLFSGESTYTNVYFDSVVAETAP